MNILENSIIKLRAPEVQDVDVLYEWENNTDFWQAGETLTPFSKYILKRYLETAHLDIWETKQIRFMIDLKLENKKYKTIGSIDLFDFDPFHHRAGIGILIAVENERRKGYANESLQLLISYSFKILQLHQIFCNIDVNNTASIDLFTKFGFQTIGVKKQWRKNEKEWTDEVMMQLINIH